MSALHYLEIFKETKDGDVYYLDDNKTALILYFSVIDICPDLDVVQVKRKGKMVSTNLVNNDIHEALCNLVVKDLLCLSVNILF